MIEFLGINLNLLLSQMFLGLINGAFYACLSLGLALIFGMLNIVNFAHGAQYMMGAFLTWMLYVTVGFNYWIALLLVPAIMFLFGVVTERVLISRLYKLDHHYGLLLTFGLTLIIQGLFRNYYGSSGVPYSVPAGLEGGMRTGFMYIPYYRLWIVAASLALCFAVWWIVGRTSLGSHLRAATEKPQLAAALGLNVRLLMTATYGVGVAIAAFAGVLAAPIMNVNPNMSSDLIIVVFAVVVIGGMGSIFGSVATGFALGQLEALAKVFYPELSSTIVFIAMALVLLLRPAGLFGKEI